MATKTWAGGAGDFFVGANWTGAAAPAAGDTAYITVGTMDVTATTLTIARIEMDSNQVYPIDPTLQLDNATVGSGTVLDLLQNTIDGNYGQLAIAGHSEFDGHVLLDPVFGVFDVADNGAGGIFTLGASGTIEVTGGADLNFFVSGFVNNGLVKSGANYSYVDSPVTGSGVFLNEDDGYLNFTKSVGADVHVNFDAGVTRGNIIINDATTFHGHIGNIAPTDNIALMNLAADGVSLSGGILTVTNHGISVASFPVSGAFSGFTVDHSGLYGLEDPNSAYLHAHPACYAAGTGIAVPGGIAPVESLRPGSAVLVLEGGNWAAKPVRWVGHFSIDLTRHPRPDSAAPILIRADAIAAGVPSRDLRVSPDHAVLLDGLLFQAQALVNGATILRERGCQRVTYHHIELDQHGLLQADGMPAESYLDTGNRGQFAAEAGVRPLFPQLSTPDAAARRCRELALDAPRIAAAHAKLAARAALLGWQRSNDPALDVLADGWAVALTEIAPRVWQGILPRGAGHICLRSRCFVPADIDPSAEDRRVLGIAVTALRLNGQPLRCLQGWHDPEPGWRWTTGEAYCAAGAGVLEITAAAAAPWYWVAPDARRLALRSAARG